MAKIVTVMVTAEVELEDWEADTKAEAFEKALNCATNWCCMSRYGVHAVDFKATDVRSED